MDKGSKQSLACLIKQKNKKTKASLLFQWFHWLKWLDLNIVGNIWDNISTQVNKIYTV